MISRSTNIRSALRSRQRGFMINPFRFGGMSFAYNPTSAYSTRRRIPTYSGACMRVRRASDNSELDIGFGAGDWLDTAAIVTFCAGSAGHVVTWYDQGASAVNLTQSTAGAQPQIYSGTGIYMIGARPAIYFSRAGTVDYLSAAADADFGFGTGAWTIEIQAQRDASSGTPDETLLDFRTGSGQNGLYGVANNGAAAPNRNRPYYFNGTTYGQVGTLVTPAVLQHFALTYVGGASSNLRQFLQGNLESTDALTLDFGATRPLYVGSNFAGAGGWDGRIGELLIDKGTNRYTASFTAPAF